MQVRWMWRPIAAYSQLRLPNNTFSTSPKLLIAIPCAFLVLHVNSAA